MKDMTFCPTAFGALYIVNNVPQCCKNGIVLNCLAGCPLNSISFYHWRNSECVFFLFILLHNMFEHRDEDTAPKTWMDIALNSFLESDYIDHK